MLYTFDTFIIEYFALHNITPPVSPCFKPRGRWLSCIHT